MNYGHPVLYYHVFVPHLVLIRVMGSNGTCHRTILTSYMTVCAHETSNATCTVRSHHFYQQEARPEDTAVQYWMTMIH